MKLLALLIIYFSASAGQEQKAIVPTPRQFDITTNVIEPISTSQAFNQYGFTPQAPTASYPITTLPLTQIVTPIRKQAFNQNPANHAFARTIAPNVPVHASYQIADHPLVSSSAHAYPVQHSVEINHGDYEPYPNIFVQQHLETPAPSRIPPITRNLRPQFANQNTPQQPLRQYNIPQQARPHFQRQFNPQQHFQPYINGANKITQPLKPYIAPSINQNVNVRGPTAKPYIQNVIPQVVRKQYIQASSTPANLPYNFKPLPVANTYQPLVKDSAQIRPSTLDNPSPLIPKPLPSPLKNLPVSPRPVPLPISGKPETKEEDSDNTNKKSSRDQEDKKPVREEEDESEESDESDEDDDEDEEDDSYERDYRPRYSHNYHEDTEFDKKRYRPTFDAAKYIFNEDGDDEEGGKSEEEGGSEEKRPPPTQDKYKERSVPKPNQGPHREKPNEPERKAERPHSKRVASDESKEQESKSSRWVPLRQDVQKRRHREYYK